MSTATLSSLDVAVRTAHTTAADSATAGAELVAALRSSGLTRADLLAISYNAAYDADVLATALREAFPDARLIGGSSCLGTMTGAGFHSGPGIGAAVFALDDPRGRYGVAACPVGSDPAAAARAALAGALASARSEGLTPDVVWCLQPPGHEELVLASLVDQLGPATPILGGSTADDTVGGAWTQCTHDGGVRDAVVVGVLFPSTRVGWHFHSGYEPTAHHGTVTRASGRTIHEIDGEPAARVFDRWTGGTITHALGGGNVLMDTTTHPFGREVGRVGDVPLHLLAHPERVTEGEALTVFANVETGDRLTLMTGSRRSLVARAGSVARDALLLGDIAPEDVAGALVVYCAGCMLTVNEEMPDVVRTLDVALGGRPFLGFFTFGEQGCFPDGQSRHGNLMITTLVFAAR